MSRTRPMLAWGALALIVLSYGFFLRAHFIPYPLGIDANAYHRAAQLLAEEGRYHQVPASPFTMVGPHWVETASGECYPKYPPFYPAILAGVMRVAGQGGALYVNPACALLALIGMFLVCRSLVPWPLALAGPLLLALNPVFAAWSLEQSSHASSVCFLAWGYAAFFRARQGDAVRRRLLLMALAGLLVGFAAGIRYTNVLLALPPLVWIAAERSPGRARRLAAFSLGLSIPYGVLAIFHWRAFGGPLSTAYSLSDEQAAFTWQYLVNNADSYVTGVVNTALGPAAVVACLGLAVVAGRRWRQGLFFAAWILPLSLLYLSYWFGPHLVPPLRGEPELFLRFLLPVVLPCLALALMFVDRIVAERRLRILALIALVLGQGLWGAARTLQVVERRWERRSENLALFEMLRREISPRAVVFAEQLTGLQLSLQGHTVYNEIFLNRKKMRGVVWGLTHLDIPGLQKKRILRQKKLLLDVSLIRYFGQLHALVALAQREGRGVYLVVDRKVYRWIRNKYGAHLASTVAAGFSGRYVDHLLVKVLAVR